MPERMSHEEFVRKAIANLRTGRYRGIHTVYSGFNEAFRKYFEAEDPVAATQRLADEGKIVVTRAKGGAMLYLPEDAPAPRQRGEDALKKMGL